MGQGLVPGPADQGRDGQREHARGQPEAHPVGGEEVGAEQVAETGQGEHQAAHDAPPGIGPPGVGELGTRSGVAALDPFEQLLGEGEGIGAAVQQGRLLVGEAVGLEDGRDLVRVDRVRADVAQPLGELVQRVGGEIELLRHRRALGRQGRAAPLERQHPQLDGLVDRLAGNQSQGPAHAVTSLRSAAASRYTRRFMIRSVPSFMRSPRCAPARPPAPSPGPAVRR